MTDAANNCDGKNGSFRSRSENSWTERTTTRSLPKVQLGSLEDFLGETVPEFNSCFTP